MFHVEHSSNYLTHLIANTMRISTYTIKGNLVDPEKRTIESVIMEVVNGKIERIEKTSPVDGPFILPGFIDSHVHIESSMLTPGQFAKMAIAQGTVAVVADPHEVANVAGIPAIRFMINDSKRVPLHFFFGVPSCVPASPFEQSGAIIGAKEVAQLIAQDEFLFLAEMMNYPGVINNDPEVLGKINAALAVGKPIDGHAPGVSGKELEVYANAGITTDHECTSVEEAEEKISIGMSILIREGSAAKNLDSLLPVLKKYPQSVMFCTDDCHPDYLERGHINSIVARVVKQGYDLFDTLYAACINPKKHYNLSLGKLEVGCKPDFVAVDDLVEFRVLQTYVQGAKVYDNGTILFQYEPSVPESFPFRSTLPKETLSVLVTGDKMNVIEAMEGDLLTNRLEFDVSANKGQEIVPDPSIDLLKIVLLNRYEESPPQIGFIKGFGLKSGALAASIAHDSHHIIAVGCDDKSIENALSWILKNKGGLCFFQDEEGQGVELPYYGLMSGRDGVEVSQTYISINNQVRRAGSSLSSPFMTLSFMALTVIPRLKLNHNGLFDGVHFRPIPLFQ